MLTRLVAALVGFVIGTLVDRWIANRWIDHRWYCGRRHPASHPCQPSPERLESWRRMESKMNRAEELEEEAKRLRRYL